MSYRCDVCGTVRYGSELKRVSEVRNVTYNRTFMRFNKREGTKVPAYDTSFRGKEIVNEERLCEKCYELRKDMNPSVHRDEKVVSFAGTKSKVNKSYRDKHDEEELDLEGLKEKFEGRR